MVPNSSVIGGACAAVQDFGGVAMMSLESANNIYRCVDETKPGVIRSLVLYD